MERRRYEQAKTLAMIPLLTAFLIVFLTNAAIYAAFNGKMPAKFGPPTIKIAFQWAYYPMTILLTLAGTTLVHWPFFTGALAIRALMPKWGRFHLVLQTGALIAFPCLCWYARPGLEDFSGVIFLAVASVIALLKRAADEAESQRTPRE